MKTKIFLNATLSILILISFIVVGSGCGGGGNNPPGGDLVAYNLQIGRFTTTGLDNNRADAIISEMQAIIQQSDAMGDVACNVGFTRSGDVSAFSTGNGIINSLSDFTAVNDLPGQVKVVNQINWCGGLSPNIIGCAPVPGNSMVVIRFTPSQEGILWLHEFGHNKGLNHRNDPNAVMNGIIGSNRKSVNQAECDNYRNRNIPLSAITFAALETAKDTTKVEDFVKQIFIQGVPYDEANKYGEDDVPLLLKMLEDSTQIAYWSNIAVTLGIIGNEQAVDPLIDLIKSDSPDTLSNELYTAKTSAIMALGYLINKSGNQKSLDFLKGCLDPHAWDESQPNWVGPFQASTEQRNYQLSTMAILGLTLSGHQDALDALHKLAEPATTEDGKKFQAQVSNVLKEALETCELISEKGLSEYYKESKK
ncbi:hypothetical protein QQ008_00910 [Fulvivirgaceae bacterium BMA10]|uniref:Peptidase M10 metallopeptidase domain-containing protein n=1 Tax=Splendidivirga corallicola TaxID=3051826 RepID=A0ABT8KI12_9BACT|nr:hypothetical protein [Fulvivirgaceae bacterium BMA10]